MFIWWSSKDWTLKQRQCLNTLPPVCVITAQTQSALQALSHFSARVLADMGVERRSACYRVAADKASGRCCVHHFTEGWNKMVSRCRPAGKSRSHQREKRPSGKKDLKGKKCVSCQCCFFLLFHLYVSFSLNISKKFTSYFVFFSFLSTLTCCYDLKARSNCSLQLSLSHQKYIPQSLGRVDKPDNATELLMHEHSAFY